MTVHDPFAAITGLPWWAVLLLAPFAIGLIVVIISTIGAEDEDDPRLIPLNEAAEQRLREWLPQAIARLCGPCTGQPGTVCICREKCDNPLCAAEDTGVMQAVRASAWRPGELDWLDNPQGEMPR